MLADTVDDGWLQSRTSLRALTVRPSGTRIAWRTPRTHRPRRKITTVHALSEAIRLEVQPAENAPFAHQPVSPYRWRAGGTHREAALLDRVASSTPFIDLSNMLLTPLETEASPTGLCVSSRFSDHRPDHVQSLRLGWW